MQITRMLSIIFFFLTIVITLALAPSINTANNTIASDNLTNLIGMTAVVQFGAPLIILGIMVAGGLMAFGMRQGLGVKDIMVTVGLVIGEIVALNFMDSIVDYTNTLIAASTGFAVTIYGIIPLIVYIAIIAAAGGYQTYKYVKSRKKKSKGATAGVNW